MIRRSNRVRVNRLTFQNLPNLPVTGRLLSRFLLDHVQAVVQNAFVGAANRG